MAENHASTGPPIARKPRRYRVDEGLDVRFLRHANSAHVSQTLWRGLAENKRQVASIHPIAENGNSRKPICRMLHRPHAIDTLDALSAHSVTGP